MAVTRPVETPTRKELQRLADEENKRRPQPQPQPQPQETLEPQVADASQSTPISAQPGLDFSGGQSLPLHGGGFRPTGVEGVDFEALTSDWLSDRLADRQTAAQAESGTLGETFESPSGARFFGGTEQDRKDLFSRAEKAMDELDTVAPEQFEALLDRHWPGWKEDFSRAGATSQAGSLESQSLSQGYKETLLKGFEAIHYNPQFVEELEEAVKNAYVQQRLAGVGERDSGYANAALSGFATGEFANALGNRNSAQAAGTALFAEVLASDVISQAGALSTASSPDVAMASAMPGKAGEAARLTQEASWSTPLGQWATGDINDEQFLAALLTRAEERSWGEESILGLASPLNLLPMPILDDLMRLVLGGGARVAGAGGRAGARSAYDVLRLSRKFTSAMSSRGRDLLSETLFTAQRAQAAGRTDVPSAYGPSGPGQFRTGAEVLEELPPRPKEEKPGTVVRIRQGIASTVTKARQKITDELAEAQNIENAIDKHLQKTMGRTLTDDERFHVKMSLLRAGVHDLSDKRFRRYTDEMAAHLKSYDGETIPADYSLRYLVLKHHEEVLKMHPEKQGVGYTLETIADGMRQLQEEVARLYDPKEGGVTSLRNTGWGKITEAAKVVARGYHEMLMESVESGFITRELGDVLYRTYPWYNPIRLFEQQQIEGLEVITKQARVGENIGERMLGADGVTIRFLSDQAWDAYKEQANPLDLLRTSILRHEQRKQLNDTVRSLIKALRNWEWESVERVGTLLKEFNMEDTPGLYGNIDPETGQMRGVFGNLGNVVTKVPRPRHGRKRPAAGGTSERPISGRSPDTTEVAFWDKGEPQFYEIPTSLYNALEVIVRMPPMVGGANIETMLRFLQYPKRAAITIYNPAFMAANFVYEMLFLATVHGVLPTDQLKNLGKGLKNIFIEDKLIEDMYQQNAVVLGLTGRRVRTPKPGEGGFPVGKQKFKEDAEIILKDQRDWARFFPTFKNPLGPLKFLNEVASAFEMSSRMSLYEQALKRGDSKQSAALHAREGMTDFAKHGSLVNFLDMFFLYLNPAVQGATIPITYISKRPLKTAMTLSLAPALAAANYSRNRTFTDETNNYYDVPLRDRYGSIIVMLPGKGKLQADGSYKPRYVKVVPFTRELAIPFGGTTHLLESLDKEMPFDMGMFWNATKDQISPHTVITSNAREAVSTEMSGASAIPTIKYPLEFVNTLQEIANNKNNFTGKPIVDPRDRNANFREGLQTTPDISSTSNLIGSLLNIAPPKIEHSIRSGLGGVIYDGYVGLDMALRAAGMGTKTPLAVEGQVYELLDIAENPSLRGDSDAIRDAQNKHLAQVDFNDYRYDPDIQARGISTKKQFLDYVNTELRKAVSGERTPWTSVVNRFMGQGSFGRSMVARIEALEELGYDNVESRAAAGQIRDARVESNEAQLALDKKLDEDGHAFTYTWRQASKHNSEVALMHILAITNDLPNAVQGNVIDYPKYIKMVSNYMGRHEVPEDRGDLLYHWWLSLEGQIYDGATGSMVDGSYIDPSNNIVEHLLADPRPVFRIRDQFLDALSDSDKDLLLQKRRIYTTPARAEYFDDMDRMEPYYAIEDAVYAGLSGEQEFRFGQWLAGTPEQKARIERDFPELVTPPMSFIESEQMRMLAEDSRETEEWNRAHPQFNPRESMQQVAMRWSIRTKPYSLEDHEYYQGLIDEVDIDSIDVLPRRDDIPPIYMP